MKILASFRLLYIKVLENDLNNNYNVLQRNTRNKKPKERNGSVR